MTNPIGITRYSENREKLSVVGRNDPYEYFLIKFNNKTKLYALMGHFDFIFNISIPTQKILLASDMGSKK